MENLAEIFRLLSFVFYFFTAVGCACSGHKEFVLKGNLYWSHFLFALLFAGLALLTHLPVRKRIHQSRMMTNVLMLITGFPFIGLVFVYLFGFIMNTNPFSLGNIRELFTNPTADPVQVAIAVLMILSQGLLWLTASVFPAWLFLERMCYRRRGEA